MAGERVVYEIVLKVAPVADIVFAAPDPGTVKVTVLVVIVGHACAAAAGVATFAESNRTAVGSVP